MCVVRVFKHEFVERVKLILYVQTFSIFKKYQMLNSKFAIKPSWKAYITTNCKIPCSSIQNQTNACSKNKTAHNQDTISHELPSSRQTREDEIRCKSTKEASRLHLLSVQNPPSSSSSSSIGNNNSQHNFGNNRSTIGFSFWCCSKINSINYSPHQQQILLQTQTEEVHSKGCITGQQATVPLKQCKLKYSSFVQTKAASLSAKNTSPSPPALAIAATSSFSHSHQWPQQTLPTASCNLAFSVNIIADNASPCDSSGGICNSIGDGGCDCDTQEITMVVDDSGMQKVETRNPIQFHNNCLLQCS